MKTLKLTLIALLAVCFVSPAMGYIEPSSQQTQGKLPGPQKILSKKETVLYPYPTPVSTKSLEKMIGSMKESPERPNTIKRLLRRRSAEARKKAEQKKSEAKQQQQAAKQQPADFCEKHCRLLDDDEMYDAEILLQNLRETTDPAASFEKYPQLMYEHSENCQYHPNNQQPAQSPAEK